MFESPSVDTAVEFIRRFHKRSAEKTQLLLVGECMIDYRGRARSFLDWGERVVMVKQDGAVLVHRPVMREPVNWQPAGAVTRFQVVKGCLMMYSYHKSPPERMRTSFRSVRLVAVYGLRDEAQLLLSGMEADVVNQIMMDPGVIEEGLRITKREKAVQSGLIDLYGFDVHHTPVVIEVKRSLATISAVQQLRMYVSDVKQDIESAEVRGILCAPRVPDMVKKLLAESNLEWQEVERKVMLPDDFQKTLKDFMSQK